MGFTERWSPSNPFSDMLTIASNRSSTCSEEQRCLRRRLRPKLHSSSRIRFQQVGKSCGKDLKHLSLGWESFARREPQWSVGFNVYPSNSFSELQWTWVTSSTQRPSSMPSDRSQQECLLSPLTNSSLSPPSINPRSISKHRLKCKAFGSKVVPSEARGLPTSRAKQVRSSSSHPAISPGYQIRKPTPTHQAWLSHHSTTTWTERSFSALWRSSIRAKQALESFLVSPYSSTEVSEWSDQILLRVDEWTTKDCRDWEQDKAVPRGSWNQRVEGACRANPRRQTYAEEALRSRWNTQKVSNFVAIMSNSARKS